MDRFLTLAEDENMEFIERRKFPRLSLSVDVEYSVIGRDLGFQTETSTKNISVGGICIIAYEKVEIGDILSLVIKLPEGERPIHAEGRVVWKSDFVLSEDKMSRWDVGIEFTDIKDDDRQKLSGYIFSLIK